MKVAAQATNVAGHDQEIIIDLSKLQHRYEDGRFEGKPMLVITMPFRPVQVFTEDFSESLRDQLGERKAEIEMDEAAHKLYQVQVMNELGKHIK